MPGEWIERRTEQHVCEPPMAPTGVTTGDQWKCSICQTVLTVTVNPDQRDGPWLSFQLEDGSTWTRNTTIPIKRTSTRPPRPGVSNGGTT